jgi:tetrahydromethanopterin S-methyltransferase subunit G
MSEPSERPRIVPGVYAASNYTIRPPKLLSYGEMQGLAMQGNRAAVKLVGNGFVKGKFASAHGRHIPVAERTLLYDNVMPNSVKTSPESMLKFFETGTQYKCGKPGIKNWGHIVSPHNGGTNTSTNLLLQDGPGNQMDGTLAGLALKRTGNKSVLDMTPDKVKQVKFELTQANVVGAMKQAVVPALCAAGISAGIGVCVSAVMGAHDLSTGVKSTGEYVGDMVRDGAVGAVSTGVTSFACTTLGLACPAVLPFLPLIYPAIALAIGIPLALLGIAIQRALMSSVRVGFVKKSVLHRVRVLDVIMDDIGDGETALVMIIEKDDEFSREMSKLYALLKDMRETPLEVQMQRADDRLKEIDRKMQETSLEVHIQRADDRLKEIDLKMQAVWEESYNALGA